MNKYGWTSSGSPLEHFAAQWVVTDGPCRARTRVPVPGQSYFYLGTGHSRRLLRIPSELEELASKVLTVEMVAAKERQRLREKRTGAPPAGGQKN